MTIMPAQNDRRRSTADKALQNQQAGKGQLSLRELMDRCLASPVQGLGFMMVPLLIPEIEPSLKLVSPRMGYPAFMLQAPGDNARRNSAFSGELPDGGDAQIAIRAELTIVTGRNQPLLRESIRLSFAGVASRSVPIALLDKNGAFAMLQDVPCLMVKREPQVVVRLASQAQLDEGLGTMQPA
jgi:hypothetical protein